jgi:hypothetical protein
MAVPNMPTASSAWRSRGRSCTACVASASMAIRPPSPLLSARRISSTYFSETMTVSVQKISDSTPSTLSREASTWPAWKISLKAYSGLVPMSP